MKNNLEFLLQIAIFFPFLAAVFIFLLKKSNTKIKNCIGLIGFLLPTIIILFLFYQFIYTNLDYNGYAFVKKLDLGLSEIGIILHTGLNGVAIIMLLLTGIVGLAAGLYAISLKIKNKSFYLILLLIIFGASIGAFSSINIFFFYFFHEITLIPAFIMVNIWGGRAKYAISMEMAIYLVLGAISSLLGLVILYNYSQLNTFNLIELKEFVARKPINKDIQYLIFPLFLFGFGVLVSLWPFHSWAPRTYTAAPTSLAMLHAGVLKKFGLYGLIQIIIPILPIGAKICSQYLIILALLGNIIIIGFIAIAQRNLKYMLSYSSVMHMGYCFLGIATFSSLGIGGAILLMLGHGISVALSFMLATCIYHRSNTYNMREIGGLFEHTPVLAFFFSATMFANIGLPGFINFWGELSIFIAIWKTSPWVLPPTVFGLIISSVYSLRSIANIFFGKTNKNLERFIGNNVVNDMSYQERYIAFLLLITLLIIGIWPSPIINIINNSL